MSELYITPLTDSFIFKNFLLEQTAARGFDYDMFPASFFSRVHRHISLFPYIGNDTLILLD